jgi:hypothetical protein
MGANTIRCWRIHLDVGWYLERTKVEEEIMKISQSAKRLIIATLFAFLIWFAKYSGYQEGYAEGNRDNKAYNAGYADGLERKHE